MSVCHADRAKALIRVVNAADKYDVLLLAYVDELDHYGAVDAAEKELIDACRALANLPDCSD